MSLPALYVLVGVVAVRPGAFLGGLRALGVHDGYGGVGVLTDPLPLRRTKDREGPVPKAAQAEPAEVVVDGRPRREVARQQPPGAATPQDVEDGVEDVAQGMDTHPHGPEQFG